VPKTQSSVLQKYCCVDRMVQRRFEAILIDDLCFKEVMSDDIKGSSSRNLDVCCNKPSNEFVFGLSSKFNIYTLVLIFKANDHRAYYPPKAPDPRHTTPHSSSSRCASNIYRYSTRAIAPSSYPASSRAWSDRARIVLRSLSMHDVDGSGRKGLLCATGLQHGRWQ
jgi:hypothetical protein